MNEVWEFLTWPWMLGRCARVRLGPRRPGGQPSGPPGRPGTDLRQQMHKQVVGVLWQVKEFAPKIIYRTAGGGGA